MVVICYLHNACLQSADCNNKISSIVQISVILIPSINDTLLIWKYSAL